jgi:calcium-dependent protein kinase
LLKKLDHPNILKIFEYFESADKWYIITEYFEGKELFDEIIDKNRLSEQISAQILCEILKALNYIHSNRIAHRDIKAENILVRECRDEYQVKVIDWGLGAISGLDLKRKCGTPEYCAPEVLTGQYNLSCDMWSVGILAYIMLSGYMPFKGKDVKETL